MSTSPAAPPNRKKFASRADYIKFLESQRNVRGEKWYQQKLAETAARDHASQEKIAASDRAWKMDIRRWSNDPSAIAQVVDGLGLGRFTKESQVHRRYPDVSGSQLLVNMSDGRFWYMDHGGLSSLRGKASSKGMLNLVCSYYEMQGNQRPYAEAKNYLIGVSGIRPPDCKMSDEELAKLKSDIAKRMAEAPPPIPEAVETEIDKTKVPTHLQAGSYLDTLRNEVARERGFTVEYLKQLEAEGVLYFGRSIDRSKKPSQRTPESRRHPVVASPVHGFETGKLVAISTRRIPGHYPAWERNKGRCDGQVAMGATFMGASEDVAKDLFATEGIYDMGALRLLRESKGEAKPTDRYMAFSGARIPEKIVAICAKRGIKLWSAFDNDIAGRQAYANLKEAATKYQCDVGCLGIDGGEVEVAFIDNDIGHQFFARAITDARAIKSRFSLSEPKDGYLRIVLPTNDKSCTMLQELRRDFWAARNHAFKADATEHGEVEPKDDNDGPSWLEMHWRRKDWNEIWKHPELRKTAFAHVGLPSPSPELAADALSRLITRYQLDPAVASAMLSSRVAYPVQTKSGPKLCWPLTSEGGAVVGSLVDPFEEKSRRRFVGDNHGLITLGEKTPISRKQIIADSLERGIEAWIASGYTASVVVVAGRAVSRNLLQRVRDNGLPLEVSAEDSKDGRNFAAALSDSAKRSGVLVATAFDRSPEITAVIDARDAEKKKRADDLAKRLNELSVKNQQKIEIIRTRDGYIQVHVANHREILSELEGVDEDQDGHVDSNEIEKRAEHTRKSQRVVVEYHGRGVTRSEASQGFRGLDPTLADVDAKTAAEQMAAGKDSSPAPHGVQDRKPIKPPEREIGDD